MIPPRTRRIMAAWLTVLTIVAWPMSIIWWAKDEPVFILSLSWLALTLTAVDIWATTDVREKNERT